MLNKTFSSVVEQNMDVLTSTAKNKNKETLQSALLTL